MEFKEQKREMIEQIKRHNIDCAGYTHISTISKQVLNAMMSVPRHDFVPESFIQSAYIDSPLSIGYGQTISQPFIVALMCEILKLKKTDRVLEIGAGSGYHAAVLSKLCLEVFTLEIVEELAAIAAKNLSPYKNVKVLCKNGYNGWQEKSPFDAISVAAAADSIPESLVDQLAISGRMIIPLKNPDEPSQNLTLVKKQTNGELYRNNILPVIFVPFVKNK
ncbi:MAG: protein-L-isoaspartate(D-aspartate) O-methyltransferase [Spirochaetia bacterium]|nr:protein-L-isoaspartate(D-aspartate) O-methyltransferase [Spirochaetia bacterium]